MGIVRSAELKNSLLLDGEVAIVEEQIEGFGNLCNFIIRIKRKICHTKIIAMR